MAGPCLLAVLAIVAALSAGERSTTIQLTSGKAATSAPPTSTLDAVPNIVPKPRKNLYAGLFRPNPRTLPQQHLAVESPRIVCGLTLMQGDPKIDPGIAVNGPKSDVEFKIRKIKPKTCRD